jgi:chemotaxis protein CheX
MTTMNTLDLRSAIDQTVKEVFDTMLTLEIELLEQKETDLQGHRLVGSVSFAGQAMGSVRLYFGNDMARLVTADMLGMEDDEIESEDEVKDVIGELSNMVGGDLKSKLCDAGLPCELSIPSVTSGKDFTIESVDWDQMDTLVFQHDDHHFMVEVYIKPVN